MFGVVTHGRRRRGLGSAPGSVGIGAGGQYSAFSFDPKTGLSNDPQLAPYLQYLTPAQLQGALDGGNDVSHELASLLIDEQTGTGSAWTAPGEVLQAPAGSSSVPWWLWGLGAVVVVKVLKG